MLKLKAYGEEHKISLYTCHYINNDNLAVQMWCWDDEEFPELWSTLTVNLTKKCKPNCAFIDINNNDNHIIDWLTENKLGTPTGNYETSGYCTYPEFEFDMEELNKYIREDIVC